RERCTLPYVERRGRAFLERGIEVPTSEPAEEVNLTVVVFAEDLRSVAVGRSICAVLLNADDKRVPAVVAGPVLGHVENYVFEPRNDVRASIRGRHLIAELTYVR